MVFRSTRILLFGNLARRVCSSLMPLCLMQGVPISRMSTCGATFSASATVASKSSESSAIWVNAMILPPIDEYYYQVKKAKLYLFNCRLTTACSGCVDQFANLASCSTRCRAASDGTTHYHDARASLD